MTIYTSIGKFRAYPVKNICYKDFLERMTASKSPQRVLIASNHGLFAEGLRSLLSERPQADVLVVGGGIIPDEDIPALKKAGVAAIFGPGTPTTEIVEFIRANVRK